MKKILCFGDSNTFGYIPESAKRYDENTRWTALLNKKLGSNYTVIEGGYNNRNGFTDSIDGEFFTGYKILPQYLKDNIDIDIVILWIGINDIQKFYNPTFDDIRTGLDSMIKTLKLSVNDIIVVSPPEISENILKGHFSYQFDETSVEKFKHLPELYKDVSDKNNVHFININQYIKVSEFDGLHYSKESHSIIADILYKYIKTIFAEQLNYEISSN